MTFFKRISNSKKPQTNAKPGVCYTVVHPLDDLPETKVDASGLGGIPMTRSVRVSLISLRAYLIAMMLLLFYHVLDLAGLFGTHVR
ncbi:MAG TPA: hypothetical protein VGW37_15595 [Terriglobia bacterium]|nr:hypothetical protein [Terriglobia bacterium]